jgi:hypothetical protein
VKVLLRVLALMLALVLVPPAGEAAAADFSGQFRTEFDAVLANGSGPLAAADSLRPGLVRLPGSQAALETELRVSGQGMTAVATLRQQRVRGQPVQSRGFFNELYTAAGTEGWQFSAGKRVVAWDVGYAFRPNDVIEQEPRRLLLVSTAEGRPLLMAEHFDARTAWSLVWVNPTHARDTRGALEPALAARWYARDGAWDWHGFARWGGHTGASAGAAVAWVASDALELHASLRALHAADTLMAEPGASGLLDHDPWVAASARSTAQWLLGGTWTNDQQLSLLVETWWDGTASSDSQWTAWNARNAALRTLAATPAPHAAVAGNLAWQASAFNASSSQRRANVYARASWTADHWSPALDLLWTPADRGRIFTASLGWQGDRVHVDAGLRLLGGPELALLAQLPTRRAGYVALTLAF